MLKSATGATLIVNDTGIYIQNGKGAMITMIGPTVTINNGALTVIVTHARAAPPSRRHRALRARRQAPPTAPNPRVLVSGQPTVDDDRAVRRSPAARSPSPAARCRASPAQWVVAATRVLVERPAGRADGQPGGLRAERARRSLPVVDADARDRELRTPMNLDFPYHFDGRGRTARATDEAITSAT